MSTGSVVTEIQQQMLCTDLTKTSYEYTKTKSERAWMNSDSYTGEPMLLLLQFVIAPSYLTLITHCQHSVARNIRWRHAVALITCAVGKVATVAKSLTA